MPKDIKAVHRKNANNASFFALVHISRIQHRELTSVLLWDYKGKQRSIHWKMNWYLSEMTCICPGTSYTPWHVQVSDYGLQHTTPPYDLVQTLQSRNHGVLSPMVHCVWSITSPDMTQVYHFYIGSGLIIMLLKGLLQDYTTRVLPRGSDSLRLTSDGSI